VELFGFKDAILDLVTIGWDGCFWSKRAWGWVYVRERRWIQSVQDIM